MNHILPFSHPNLPTLDQVGGKGMGLMQMTAAGMPVPPGVVITTRFFEPWIEILRQSPEWENIARNQDVAQNAKVLQLKCSAFSLTADQKSELDQALKALNDLTSSKLYAVRSSSPEEDLDGASFAGGYETTLGVKMENIEEAIRNSFASSFDERVFVYKHEHHFSFNHTRIAVVIQQQVDAEAAGVAFSINPLNNCYDEAVINANEGLGESVVSGEVEPDQFIVDKISDEIIDTRLGAKQSVTRLNHEGGTRKFTSINHGYTAITPSQVIELTHLLIKVEKYYQKPVDIEWAFADGKFFLLQARPITTYLPLPKEMLTAPGAPKHLYANSTLIEQGLQEPLSVLGTDFLNYVLQQVGGAVAKDSIGPGGTTFTAGGGYYMDISYARKLNLPNGGLAPGSAGDPQATAILDNIDMRPYLKVELSDRLKAMRGKMVFSALPMLKGVIKAYFKPELILKQYQTGLPKENLRFESYTGAGLSLHQQAIRLSELLQFFYSDLGISMILAGLLAQRRLQSLFKGESVQDQLVNLGIALPGNKTTEMGEAMYTLAISPVLKGYSNAAEFLTALEMGELPQAFVKSWKDFLAEYGFRCPREIDPATPRPNEQPGILFEQLKKMSLAANGSQSFFDDARSKRETAYQTLRQIAQIRGQRSARAFERYYNRWLTFGGYRETPKHYVIKVIALFRRQALTIANTFVENGRLDTPEQIFDLTIADIDNAIADPALNLRGMAKERSALIQQIRRSHFVARIIDSRGKIFYPPRKASNDGEMTGLPISPGVVQGRVKVLHSADEKTLLPGEILVARATDPGWTPMFINAAGVILEIGGVLQHGAVVAREYGLPCVSGVDDATSLLKDGQLVEVDGSNGVVRVLDGEKPTFQPISEAEANKQSELEAIFDVEKKGNKNANQL